MPRHGTIRCVPEDLWYPLWNGVRTAPSKVSLNISTALVIDFSFFFVLYSYNKQPWTRFVTSENRAQASPESIDLLDKLLRYDHRQRLTAHEAQAHAYFSEISPMQLFIAKIHWHYLFSGSVRLEAKGDSLSDSGFCSTWRKDHPLIFRLLGVSAASDYNYSLVNFHISYPQRLNIRHAGVYSIAHV